MHSIKIQSVSNVGTLKMIYRVSWLRSVDTLNALAENTNTVFSVLCKYIKYLAINHGCQAETPLFERGFSKYLTNKKKFVNFDITVFNYWGNVVFFISCEVAVFLTMTIFCDTVNATLILVYLLIFPIVHVIKHVLWSY